MKLELRILPWALLSFYAVKVLILGAQYVDAPILLILAGFLAIFEYKAKDSQYKELQEKQKKIDEELAETNKKIEEMKVHLSSMKLASQIKNNNLFGR